MNQQEFVELVWDYYRQSARDLPWRTPLLNLHDDSTLDPYVILVSELMLQQTQVARVVPKYNAFLDRFPTVQHLAKAPLADVLRLWSGLGYNRRAKYLHEAAKTLVSEVRPWKLENLIACKGIGFNTAAAVVTYAYNQPVAFIETNIRTVYIHHFFSDRTDITDKEIMPVIEATLDHEHPREWCWALMDYGSHLKRTVGNTARLSKHYVKQSAFHGSKRQIRGRVLKLLAVERRSWTELQIVIPDDRLKSVIDELIREGFVNKNQLFYQLAS